MATLPPKAAPSPPFANRELNGELLLEEISELRNAQVPQRQLNDCVGALKDLMGTRASEASAHIKVLATARFAQHPAMAALLVRWASRLKTDVDVPLLFGHFERLARVSAAMSALRRASERLPKGGRG
ncbi:MAG: hypothetical protein JNK82_10150 [Myxococcaceae bacterium]|nr:hypothetical protein [Myxococcaceae bacterium]